jgi:hypothetical protein
MAVSFAALALMVSLAQAPETDHHMYQPQAPETVGYPNWVVSPTGYARLSDALKTQSEAIAQKEAEAAKLRADVVELAAKPELTWQGVVVMAGLALTLGLVVGIPVGIAVGKR